MADADSRKGARYADAAITTFVQEVHAPHDPALARAFGAPEQHGMPAIQVSPTEAGTAALLLRLVGARKVIEVGTLAGYSAIRMARALPEGGKLWTIELDERHADIARDNIEAAGLGDRVEVLVGAGLSRLGDLAPYTPVDAFFVDADKKGYPDYLEYAIRYLRPGGLLLADNVYLFGRLMEASDEGEAMRRFHRQAAERFDTACLPTPDGMLLGIKR